MYYLYILKSLTDLGYYVGTTENVDKRLSEHNREKTKSTKHRIPFIVLHTEKYNSKTEARKREILLKKNYKARKDLLITLGFDIK